MIKQTKLKTHNIVPTNNISFPIGTALCVQKYARKLDFDFLFGKYKHRGRSLPHLIEALISYRLTENRSMTKASDWINRDEVLEEFNLDSFEQRTLFRVLEILGKNREQIIFELQNKLFSSYDFEHTNINLDWTSIILHGDNSPLGAYGYSRDHRPDKKQITLGLAELANPINIPIGLTIKPGNINDQNHFKDTYKQVKDHIKPGSRVVFDKGAHSKGNTEMIVADKMKYLTARKFNKSDDKIIKGFDKSKPEFICDKYRVYGIKHTFPNRTNYFYFSETLHAKQLETKMRKAQQLLLEAKQIQKSIDNNRELPKKFRINNVLIDIKYSYQTRLSNLNEKNAFELVKKASINGREGFFCLTSVENLTLKEALEIYRQKDSIEKIFHSLKNEIEIKPLRVWSENSIYGALIIGFIAQLIISLLRYDYKELKHVTPKFIKISLMNLTVTVEFTKIRSKRRIYSNFDSINRRILMQNYGIT